MPLSNRNVATMGMLIALNVAIGGLVHVVKLPVFLDAIGTILAAVLLGWVGAIIVGVLSFVIAAAMINPVYIWFIGTQAILAVTVYLLATRASIFRSWPRVVAGGIALGVVAGVVSAPVIVYVFGGVAGSGRDLITAAIMSTGEQIGRAVFLSGAASEPVDKVLQMLFAFLILRSLPKRILQQFKNKALERNEIV